MYSRVTLAYRYVGSIKCMDYYIIVIRIHKGVYEIYKPEGPRL